jgi:hypothetical protein
MCDLKSKTFHEALSHKQVNMSHYKKGLMEGHFLSTVFYVIAAVLE